MTNNKKSRIKLPFRNLSKILVYLQQKWTFSFDSPKNFFSIAFLSHLFTIFKYKLTLVDGLRGNFFVTLGLNLSRNQKGGNSTYRLFVFAYSISSLEKWCELLFFTCILFIFLLLFTLMEIRLLLLFFTLGSLEIAL